MYFLVPSYKWKLLGEETPHESGESDANDGINSDDTEKKAIK